MVELRRRPTLGHDVVGGREHHRRAGPGAPAAATTSPRSASAPPASSTPAGPPCCSRRTWPGATSRCGPACPSRIAHPGGGRQRRQRHGAGRERGSAPAPGTASSCASRWHRHRRRDRHGRPGLPRRERHGRRVRAHAGRARTATAARAATAAAGSSTPPATPSTREARELIVARSPVAHHLTAGLRGRPDAAQRPAGDRGRPAGRPAVASSSSPTWAAGSGTGAAGLVAAFDPDAIVIGGGVSDAGELLLGPTRESMLRSLVGRGYRAEPPILLAEPRPAGRLHRRRRHGALGRAPVPPGRPSPRAPARAAAAPATAARAARRGLVPQVGPAGRLTPPELGV